MDESIPKKPPDQFVKDINVLLLKNRDFRGEDGKPFMPTDGERSTLQRRTYLGQYKSKVRFHASMSSDMVKKKLQEIFPYLKSRSFYTCAAVKLSNQGKRFEYHGSPRIWDGKTILDKLKWNSALYILEDEASFHSETELSSTKILEGGDDDMNSIATDTNQASSQSETELSSTNILQGGDDDMNSIATYTNQMSDSSDEVFSSTNNATSSGISGSEPEFSKDVTDMSSLLQWLQGYLHFDINGNPNYSHLRGGGPIIFTFTPPLPSAVTSVLATFEWLGTIELERLKNGSWLGYFPASPVPAVINVMLKSQNDILLGQTKVTYGVNLQQVVSCPSELQKFCENYYNMHHGSLSGNPGTSGGETENSRNLGFKQQVQMLCLMIYVAAECGAQQSLEIIFTSSAGIVAFNAYKNNLTLPEVIARDHGNTETANYLEGITKRFSEEIRTGKECSQTIDWSELVNAAKAAQKQHNITGHEERDVPKETGYLGDVDTSSSESSEPHSSDSDDDISTTSSNGSIGQKGEIQLKRDLLEDCLGEAKDQHEVENNPFTEIETEEEKWKRPDWVYEDHATETNKTCLSQTPISFFKDGKFGGKQVNVKIKPLNWEQNPLHLISDYLVQEALNLRQLACLHRSDVSFLLRLGEEPVEHHLITGYERLGNLLKSTKERNTYCMMHTGTAEDRPSLGNLSILVGYNDDHKSSSMDSLLQLYRRLFNEDSFEGPESQKDCFPEFTTTPTNENLTVKRKSTEFSTERCHSTGTGVWMLTYVSRPARKILFAYIADSRDVLHHESCFDDEDHKLSMQCLQWQRCRNNLLKVKGMHKLSGFIQPAQILSLLVGATEESGAQQFIEMMFTSSASKTDFGACKDLLLLQRVIAKDHRNEEAAHYLEDVTKRTSGGVSVGEEWSPTISCSAETVQQHLSSINDQECEIRLQRDLHSEDCNGDSQDQLDIYNEKFAEMKDICPSEVGDLKCPNCKKVSDKAKEARSHGNLRNAPPSHGESRLCLKLAKEIGNKTGEGDAYGKFETHFRDLADLRKDKGNKVGEGSANGDLGTAFLHLGDYRKAIDYYEWDLKIAKEIGNRAGEGRAYGNIGTAIGYFELCLETAKEVGDKAGKGSAYGNLGTAFLNLGDFRKAIDFYELDLKIAKEIGNRAGEGRAYGNLGNAFLNLGDFRKAIDYYELHLEIVKEEGDKNEEANAYYRLGLAFESLGALPKAFECYQLSLRLFNHVRNLLQGEDGWKVSYRNQVAIAYTSLCRVRLKQGKIVEALFAAEKGRAQALTDLMLSQFGLGESQTMPKEEKEQCFQLKRSIPSSTVFQAFDNVKMNFWALSKDDHLLLRQREISNARPLLDDSNHFLQSLIHTTYKQIGVRSEVICEDRSMDALRQNTHKADEKSDEKNSQIFVPQESCLSTLYNILIQPIADLVMGDELIIVPDGPLWLAPYAALVDADSKYLCDSFRIRLIPSLTSLRLIADCPKEYHSRSGALLVGDPWLDEVVNSKGERFLDPLPFARKEVEIIGQILNVTPLIGKKATKCEVLNDLSSVALVHIAAHGSMETGEIALTPDPKRASRIPTKEDYLLKIADVLSVKMRARLVVLSCCHSGRGEIKAEGVVGIARAFMGAGARSVLVSLWAIDDEATLEFMKSFYHHLVKGRSASESLNQAMKCLRESDKFSDVRHWAPFVLIGDDVTLDFDQKK